MDPFKYKNYLFRLQNITSQKAIVFGLPLLQKGENPIDPVDVLDEIKRGEYFKFVASYYLCRNVSSVSGKIQILKTGYFYLHIELDLYDAPKVFDMLDNERNYTEIDSSNSRKQIAITSKKDPNIKFIGDLSVTSAVYRAVTSINPHNNWYLVIYELRILDFSKVDVSDFLSMTYNMVVTEFRNIVFKHASFNGVSNWDAMFSVIYDKDRMMFDIVMVGSVDIIGKTKFINNQIDRVDPTYDITSDFIPDYALQDVICRMNYASNEIIIPKVLLYVPDANIDHLDSDYVKIACEPMAVFINIKEENSIDATKYMETFPVANTYFIKRVFKFISPFRIYTIVHRPNNEKLPCKIKYFVEFSPLHIDRFNNILRKKLSKKYDFISLSDSITTEIIDSHNTKKYDELQNRIKVVQYALITKDKKHSFNGHIVDKGVIPCFWSSES